MTDHIKTQGIVEAHPESLLDVPMPYWWAVYVKPRQDRKILADLVHQNIACVGFFEKRLRSYPGKGTQVGYVPLLGGYVFVASQELQTKEAIYATGRVLTILDVPDPRELQADICALRMLLARNGGENLVMKPEICAGDVVMVNEGIMAGCSGIVQQRQGNTFLVVNLHILGNSVATQLDVDCVDAAPDTDTPES